MRLTNLKLKIIKYCLYLVYDTEISFIPTSFVITTYKKSYCHENHKMYVKRYVYNASCVPTHYNKLYSVDSRGNIS